MARRTHYISTISVPVYAYWRCDVCDRMNCSDGIINCSRQDYTTSSRKTKQEGTRQKVQGQLQANWKEDVYELMIHPRANGVRFRNNFVLDNTKCKNCGAKPIWDKGIGYAKVFLASFPTTVITGLLAFGYMTNIFLWLIFAVCLVGFIYGITAESSFEKMMGRLTIEFTPVIGTQNEELIDYSRERGKLVPTREQCAEIVQKHGGEKSELDIILDMGANNNNDKSSEIRFCRKCGVELNSESDYCHKCGTRVIK